MKKSVKNRLITTLTVLFFCAFGIYLFLYTISDNIVFFYSPSEFVQNHKQSEVRIGGIVKEGSIVRPSPNLIEFVITDYKNEIYVRYNGIIPMLFREKQGVVASGKMENNIFIAKNLLTKHDENYKPPIQ